MVELLSPATVFYLRGAGAPVDYLTGWLGGVFDRPPYTPRRIDYPADLSQTTLTVGVEMFDQAARSTVGNIIAVAHSQGCQVLSAWMEKYRNDWSAPSPNRLMFVLTGNPIRNPTGQLVGGFVVGGGRGVATPTDTPWRVVDVARKGDTWAIKAGNWFSGWSGKLFVHPFYKGVDLFNPISETQIGNTTSLIVP